METFLKFLQQLFGDFKSLLIVVGVGTFLVGASGGFTYFPIVNQWAQVLTILVGLGLIGLGVVLVLGPTFTPAPSNPFGIEIRSPLSKSEVSSRVTVAGTIAKRPPDDHQFWLVRIYPTGRYYPLAEVKPKRNETTWTQTVDIGATLGEERDIAAYVIGPVAQAFIEYQREAADVHRRLVDKYKVPDGAEYRYLPAFKGESLKVLDMIHCHSISIKRV